MPMHKNVAAFGLLALLLLLAACAPATIGTPVDEEHEIDRVDVDVLVCASPHGIAWHYPRTV